MIFGSLQREKKKRSSIRLRFEVQLKIMSFKTENRNVFVGRKGEGDLCDKQTNKYSQTFNWRGTYNLGNSHVTVATNSSLSVESLILRDIVTMAKFLKSRPMRSMRPMQLFRIDLLFFHLSL